MTWVARTDAESMATRVRPRRDGDAGGFLEASMTLDELVAAIEAGRATNEDVAAHLGWSRSAHVPAAWYDESAHKWWDGLPDWLGSLDAATRLVPADCRYMLTNSWEWADSNVSSQDVPVAEVWRPNTSTTPMGRYKIFRGRAPKGSSPAAALTIAALRARAAGC